MFIASAASVGASDAFLGGGAVVHRKGVDVQRQPSARQHAVVGRMVREQPLDHRHHLTGQRRRVRIHALAQRRARRQQPDAQRVLEELVAAQVLDRVEIALALHQQAQVAAHDVAGGHTGAHRQRRIDASEHWGERLQEVPDQGQAGGRGELVVELLDLDRAHGQIFQTKAAHRHWASPAGCKPIEVRSRIQVEYAGGPYAHTTLSCRQLAAKRIRDPLAFASHEWSLDDPCK